MIRDVRVKIASGILLGVLSVLGSAQAHAAASPIRYACEGRQNLVIARDRATAQVDFIDRSYKLTRKPSSFGVKYESPHAVLIIDRQSAVFVAEDRLQLGACTEAFTTPSVAD